MRQINAAGLQIIKTCEGLRLAAYKDVRGIPTIGYGHTGNVQMGSFITQPAALQLLDHDLEESEACIDQNVLVPLSDNQFSALVSLTFNIGAAAFKRSTLLRLLNRLDYEGAGEQILVWDMADGKLVPGLLARRKAEYVLFHTPGAVSSL
jgi:lysozyme